MEEFIKSFVEGTDPQNAKSEISRYLFQFRVNVNPNLFRPYPSSEIEDFLYQILLQLSKCIDTNSASTTVSVFSATTAFLIKIIQFYSAEMQKAFISFVKCADRQKQIVQQSLDKLELMKKALMQEYFG